MKVKLVKSVELEANAGYTIPLNGGSKAGDTVAKEIVLSVADGGSATLADADGNTVKVINANTFDVEEYSGGNAIVMADGLDSLVITPAAATTLTYKVLV